MVFFIWLLYQWLLYLPSQTNTNTKYTKMTPEVFREKHNKVKELIKGHGRDIAQASGYSYTTYFNVIRGLVTDPVKIEAVWGAMREKVLELTSEIHEI